jgi:3-oxoacyl-[acyl-carrier-protein] synthase II
MSNSKIFITGLGSISALGYGADETWDNMYNSTGGVKLKTSWKDDRIKAQYCGEIPEVDFSSEVTWKDRFPPNTYSKIGILACKKAIEDAKIELNELNNEIGLIIETSLGATESVEDYLHDLYSKGIAKVSPIKFTKTVANTVLGDVSRVYKLNGPSSLIFNENSVNYGYDLIQKGMADIVICGGVDHTTFRILSEQETGNLMNTLKGDSVEDLNKRILGDGASFIVLESERSVNRRGITPYAEIIEQHNNFDYRNIESTTTRSSFVLEDAYKYFEKYIDKDKNVVFLSAYCNEVQVNANEESILNKIKQTNNVCHLIHKTYTGDMKAASSVMGVSIASQILKRGELPIKNKQNILEPHYAFINCTHEGGSNSQFLLRKI